MSMVRIRASCVAPEPRVASNHGGAGRALLTQILMNQPG